MKLSTANVTLSSSPSNLLSSQFATLTRCAKTPACAFTQEQTISSPSVYTDRMFPVSDLLDPTPRYRIVVEPSSYPLVRDLEAWLLIAHFILVEESSMPLLDRLHLLSECMWWHSFRVFQQLEKFLPTYHYVGGPISDSQS